MPEVAEIKQPETAASVAASNVGNDPFDDNSWSSAPPQPAEPPAQAAPPAGEPPKEPIQPATPPKQEDDFEVFDSNEYLKQQLGYDNWEAAKTELQQLRELKEKAQTPAEIKFANEQSQKFFDALKEGKTDDVYSFLHRQKQLDRLEKLELASVNDAAEIIKANLQFKNPDLTQKEIDFLYNKRYSIPPKPVKGYDQSDEDYADILDNWKQAAQEREQEIIIEAKLARPELAKFKSELVLPDIPKAVPQQPQPDPKVLEANEAARNLFLKTVDSEYSKFSGYETKVKDDSVELPVSFTVPDDEKVAYANKLKDFDINVFFENRWFDKQGNPQVNQMMADLYLLENPGKVLQGLANNAASKRMDHHLKTKSNVKVDGASSSNSFTPPAKEVQIKKEEALWGD